ncbi:MAG TPA: glycolate oxidase iron-sulfur subunit [Gammaproteobacteria bacterium]|jgi:glycolate oxidase iron-sulfur subunit|nr:glycolate oxidase iron-sulfur subunit [Gammaproteobacteria bacterium]
MQTQLTDDFKNTTIGKRADSILRSCVHCGFCNATCPTYQIKGDELDGPRGRIYLIKQLLEGNTASENTQQHLDRCLTCLNCETTCPSGVQYHKLLEIGREKIEAQNHRSAWDKFQRFAIKQVFPYQKRFSLMMWLARSARPLMPPSLKSKISPKPASSAQPEVTPHKRKMLLLDGCVQPALQPSINRTAIKIFDHLGIELSAMPQAGCCGSLSHHMADTPQSKRFMRNNIDAWWPEIEKGAEAIVITASGCGTHIKEYGDFFTDEPAYADRAKKVSELCKDISEILIKEDLSDYKATNAQPIVFHPPCTLQHGQKITGVVEQMLEASGFTLLPVTDRHLCCGSAGTYSLLQPEISTQLLKNKLDNLQSNQPELIVTSNIGCQEHLATKSNVPVMHWIELLERSNLMGSQ